MARGSWARLGSAMHSSGLKNGTIEAGEVLQVFATCFRLPGRPAMHAVAGSPVENIRPELQRSSATTFVPSEPQVTASTPLMSLSDADDFHVGHHRLLPWDEGPSTKRASAPGSGALIQLEMD